MSTAGMRNQIVIVFQLIAGLAMILVGVVGEAVWFNWRLKHGDRQSLLMQAIPLGVLYILNGVTTYLAGKQESNTIKQGIAMVMSLLAGVAAIYILCITADLLAMERHKIKTLKSNDEFENEIHNSVKAYLTVLACVLLLSLVEILITLYMARNFHKRVSKWHQKFVDRLTSVSTKAPIYTPDKVNLQYQKLATIPESQDDMVIVLPSSSTSDM